ncbi:TrmB family transcriptional regulator [Streptomyces sp. NPDC096354]|uniref:TrmB family transcriptional regulator n=1 Tax=Streptomyces sp. NPDC096354 TaxID=3366088 RepID=UPI0037F9222B
MTSLWEAGELSRRAEFDALGLSETEARLYAQLVRSGPRRADELQDLIGVSAGRASSAANGLAAKGLLTRSEGERALVIVSPPDIAGEVLMLRRMQELHTARAAMSRLVDEYRSAPQSDGGRPLVEHTPDEAVAQRIDQIQRTARHEVMIFDMPPYIAGTAQDGAAGNRTEFERLAAGSVTGPSTTGSRTNGKQHWSASPTTSRRGRTHGSRIACP